MTTRRTFLVTGLAGSAALIAAYWLRHDLALPRTRLTMSGSVGRRLDLALTSRNLNDLLAAVPSTRNNIVPVGTVVPLTADTVAVNVTDCPDALGFCDEIRLVVVPVAPSAITFCRRLPKLELKLPLG